MSSTEHPGPGGELLPCPTPWCEDSRPYVFERRSGICGVYCPGCQVSTPYFESPEIATEFWNTRALTKATDTESGR